MAKDVSQTFFLSSVLPRLCAWYRSQCDGEWEHSWGVEIGSLDNPGWRVEIDLGGTSLEDVPFEPHEDCMEHETAWIRCWREDRKFHAACGPEQLDAALCVFLDWADSIENAG